MNGLDLGIATSKNEMKAEPIFDGWRQLLNGLAVGGDDVTDLLDHLHALMGGDLDTARRWLHTENLDFGCSPFAAIAGSAGVAGVVDYLAGYRFKN
jgi:Protein of unknown function (DUF2384)